MTREEAIRWLEDIHRRFNPTGENLENEGGDVHLQALDMAIETLSAEAEQTIRHIENNTKESDLVYRSSADDTFGKSQLIMCNFVKECNGVCPFEDALKHADKMQAINEQHIINHDREWIIGCIEHDGFIRTHRFDKANQIILEALQNERRWIPCSERLPERNRSVSDLIYIVAEGAYEDEMIEYVCFAKEEAYYYVETNEKEKDCYIIYELRLNTQYDVNSKEGLPTEHIIYAPWLRREDGEA